MRENIRAFPSAVWGEQMVLHLVGLIVRWTYIFQTQSWHINQLNFIRYKKIPEEKPHHELPWLISDLLCYTFTTFLISCVNFFSHTQNILGLFFMAWSYSILSLSASGFLLSNAVTGIPAFCTVSQYLFIFSLFTWHFCSTSLILDHCVLFEL